MNPSITPGSSTPEWDGTFPSTPESASTGHLEAMEVTDYTNDSSQKSNSNKSFFSHHADSPFEEMKSSSSSGSISTHVTSELPTIGKKRTREETTSSSSSSKRPSAAEETLSSSSDPDMENVLASWMDDSSTPSPTIQAKDQAQQEEALAAWETKLSESQNIFNHVVQVHQEAEARMKLRENLKRPLSKDEKLIYTDLRRLLREQITACQEEIRALTLAKTNYEQKAAVSQKIFFHAKRDTLLRTTASRLDHLKIAKAFLQDHAADFERFDEEGLSDAENSGHESDESIDA